MARVLGDGQFVCEARRLADLIADGGLRGRGPHEDHGRGVREKVPVFLHVLTSADLALHARMAGYWTRFAASRDPNDAWELEWPEYSKNHEEHIVFDALVDTREDLGDGRCDFWSDLFLRSFLAGVPAGSP